MKIAVLAPPGLRRRWCTRSKGPRRAIAVARTSVTFGEASAIGHTYFR
jgi:hypothetical protein